MPKSLPQKKKRNKIQNPHGIMQCVVGIFNTKAKGAKVKVERK